MQIAVVIAQCAIKNKGDKMRNNTCCFSGNRSDKLPWRDNENDEMCLEIIDKTRELIKQAIADGYEYFITGMAIGYDMICAEIVIELKNEYPHIKLIGAIPCRNQEKYWTIRNKERYQNILQHLSTYIVLSREYNSKCIERRNQYMVNNSSLLIALYDGKRGGVKNTIEYAKQKGLEIKIIDF